MQFDWWTFALQLVNFLVLVWLLWRFLYRPVREVIEKRKALAEHAFAEAETLKNDADAARRRFEEDRARLARERQDLLKEARDELEVERRKVLQDAAVKAETILQEARVSVAQEKDAALADVCKNVVALAAGLASQIMRKAGASAPNGLFLETLESQLREMREDDRERLRKDLEPEGVRLTVLTAFPMASDEQRHWTDRLGLCLGGPLRTEFAVDPDLLGGAELHFPHAVLRFSWTDQLQKAKELLGRDDAAS